MIRYGNNCDDKIKDKIKDKNKFFKFLTSKKLYITLAFMLITIVYSTIYPNLNEQEKLTSVPGIVILVVFSITTLILPMD